MAGRASVFLLLCLLFTVLVHALPAVNPSTSASDARSSKSSNPSTASLSDFTIFEPQPDTLWVAESLPTVSWDKSLFPEGATIDIALLSHERKESTLLRRYVPARIGSTMINLRPELRPGTYALLITAFKDRTTTIVARSLVQSIMIIADDSDDEFPDASSLAAEQGEEENIDSEHEEKNDQLVKVDTSSSSTYEQLALSYQPTGSVVVRAPYTLGWTIPAPLRGVKHAKVDILLVNDMATDNVVAVLVTRLNAHTGFMYVHLPDTVPRGRYRIKIEMYGKGRRFVGYTSKFNVRESAMSLRKGNKAPKV